MDKRTQRVAILDYLEEHGRITIRDIQSTLRINGATARISDLRRQGYNIEDRFERPPVGAPYKVYSRGPDQFNQKGVLT